MGDCSSEPFLHIFPFQGVEGGRAQNRARCDCWPVAVLCDSCQSLDGALEEHLRRTFRLSHNGAGLFVWAAAARFFSLNPDSDPYQWLQLTYHFCTLCRTDKRMLSEMCIHMVCLFLLRLPHFTRLKFIRYECILGLKNRAWPRCGLEEVFQSPPPPGATRLRCNLEKRKEE